MSDPLSNLEIQDVLSSIRRLVSEDRRTKETGGEAAAADDVSVGKLLLTEAHRIETVADRDDDAAEVEAVAMPADLRAAEATQDADWTATLAEASGARAEPAPIRPASVLEDDMASLETTIAELEAAVAGGGHDFEPDGSEVSGVADDPDQQALEDAFDSGFVVDVGGPSGVGHDAAALALPVAGDAMSAPRPGRAPDQPVAAEIAADDSQDAEDETGAEVDEIAFLRHEPAARRPDWQVISGGDGLLATAGAILSGRLHLRPTDSVEDAGVTADDDAGGAAEAARATEALTDTPTAPADDDAVTGRGAETGDTEAVPAEDDLAELASVPAEDEVAERASVPAEDDLAQVEGPGPAAADAAEVVLTGIPTAAEEAAAAVLSYEGPGADAATIDAPAEDDIGLFGADEDAVIDMDMLRDLVAEVIREELQGPLGERITRNVRKLVRQEIARALEAQKFD